MGLIEVYLTFALATSLFALIDIFMPSMKQARNEGIDNVLTQNPKLSYFIYVCITTIIAPVVFLPLVIPSLNERFREGVCRTIYEQDQ